MENTDDSTQIVFPNNQLKFKLGKSNQANYIYDYLGDLNANTYVVENRYIDKDYLIDFAKFYARSFNVDEKYTQRFHFFSEKFSNDEFITSIIENDDEKIKKIQQSYLGFTILRPIKDWKGNPYIGRTVFKTYPLIVNDENRFYLTQKYHFSLFGIPLTVESLPFQAQDSAVGGCATTACWVALHPLHTLFGIQKYAPYEITNISVAFPTLNRNFPSTGLTLYQMKSQFNALGLETEFINVDKIGHMNSAYQANDDIVADAVKAYCNLGLPIIAALRLCRGTVVDYHAVVISGYRHKNGKITELYIHDDQIGPFHRVKPCGNFSNWLNEWVNKYGITKIEVERLIIPIYEKLRLNFGAIYSIYLDWKQDLIIYAKKEKVEESLRTELLLVGLNDYKNFLLSRTFSDKVNILKMNFPRFIWVMRATFQDKIKRDLVFDGTSVFPILIKQIDFSD